MPLPREATSLGLPDFDVDEDGELTQKTCHNHGHALPNLGLFGPSNQAYCPGLSQFDPFADADAGDEQRQQRGIEWYPQVTLGSRCWSPLASG
jgi:hypothetical protein